MTTSYIQRENKVSNALKKCLAIAHLVLIKSSKLLVFGPESLGISTIGLWQKLHQYDSAIASAISKIGLPCIHLE